MTLPSNPDELVMPNTPEALALAKAADKLALDRLWDGLATLNDSNHPAWLGLTHVKNRLTALEAEGVVEALRIQPAEPPVHTYFDGGDGECMACAKDQNHPIHCAALAGQEAGS